MRLLGCFGAASFVFWKLIGTVLLLDLLERRVIGEFSEVIKKLICFVHSKKLV